MSSAAETARPAGAFARNERGNVAMLFALSCLVIFPMVGFAIDFSRVMVDKHKLQMATDAAVLAAAHDAFMTPQQRTAVIESHINALEADIGRDVSYSMTQDSEGRISLTTNVRVNTTIARITGRENVDVSVRADAIEGGADIEVAMILDITGSMSGNRITALRQAAKDLVDIVVSDDQTPYYSKASMVPYSVAVNVGTYADAVRGAVTPGRSITGAAWQVGATKNISSVTKQNPARVNSTGHGLTTGDRVRITGVGGMTQVNNNIYTVTVDNADRFRLNGVNSTNYTTAQNNTGQFRKCINTNCEVTVTANNHGLANGDHVVISGVNGMTQINTATNATWQVSGVTQNTYVLVGSQGWNYGTYSNNTGTSYCTVAGCEWYRFNNAYDGAQRLHRMSTCATERTGAQAYTDVSPAGNPVGRGYLSTANPCPANALIPLTSDKDDLEDAIDDLVIGGSTAGHMGAVWGWYTLSPTFGAIFPTASRPAAYGRPKLHKFAMFMTDGDFNSSFCQGVLSGASTSGSGDKRDQINCNPENGASFAQTSQYCTAMKNAGITVYTVGFEVGNLPAARAALTDCATSPQYAYFASGSAELVEVFQQIGNSINEVRLVQ